MIVVERAPPYLTIQDSGRTGYRESGVPPGGAMDQWSLAIANLLVGNDRSAAGLEWAIAGGVLRFENDATIAICGAEVEATVDDVEIKSGERLSVRRGQALKIPRIVERRFAYIAISGGIESPRVLGSRSTYLPAGIGGIEGRRLQTGDCIPITRYRLPATGYRQPPSGVAPDYNAKAIRVVPVNEASDSGFDRFVERTYKVSAASDRMGYRLEPDGPLEKIGASITSEPVCAGAIQVPPNGEPIVLMADSPTVGGYRIAGTVIACDMPVLAQSMPGRSFKFVAISVAMAQEEFRRREKWLAERFVTEESRSS